MTASDDSIEYQYNPFYKFHELSDYSIFYVTLALCFAFVLFLLILNIYFCCFSEHKRYWTNSYNGNYWIFPFWVRGPSGQAPVDLKELEWVIKPERAVYQAQFPDEYLELERKESDI